MSSGNRYVIPEINKLIVVKKTQKTIDYESIKRDMEITRETESITERIKYLNARRKELNEEQKDLRAKRNKKARREIQLYALRLEDGYWYIGASAYPLKRFTKHKIGKGAKWTKLHPPIELVETRGTGKYRLDETSLLEDDMTVEYAMKFGSNKVRGGGRCQAKPRWPSEVIENERQPL